MYKGLASNDKARRPDSLSKIEFLSSRTRRSLDHCPSDSLLEIEPVGDFQVNKTTRTRGAVRQSIG